MMRTNQILVELLRLNQGDLTNRLFPGTYLNTNPRHYKYYWHIAILNETGNDLIWFRNLTTYAHEMLINDVLLTRCRARKASYYLYNYKLPRWQDHPLRADSDRFDGVWAPPYDTDPDPIWRDHHK